GLAPALPFSRSYRDDDFSSRLAILVTAKGFREPSQLVAPVDDGFQAAGFDELFQESHVLLMEWLPPPHHRHLLVSRHGDQRSKQRPLENQPGGGTEHHIGSSMLQHPPPFQHRTTSDDVQDEVIPLPRSSHVLSR